MNALRQASKSNLRSFFSSIPTPSPVSTTSEPKANKRGKAKKEQPHHKQKQKEKPYRKKKITGALREAVWIKTMGRTFEGKCPVSWCPNSITVFDFQSGHNIPESKGGSTTLPNLIAICARCNFSMGNHYTIDEWNALHAVPFATPSPSPPRPSLLQKLFCCFFKRSN